MKFISLFSGAGGLDLGFEQVGFHPVIAYDSNQAAVDTYNYNRVKKVARKLDLSQSPTKLIVKNMPKSFVTSRVKGVVGGPPCQYFSMGNRTEKNYRDPRRKLPIAYANMLKGLNREFALDFFIFENVYGLAKPAHKKDFEKIISMLDAAGFNVFYDILDAYKFNVPQKRRRLFIVGWNKIKYPNANYSFPKGISDGLSVKDAIWGLKPPQIFERGLDSDAFPVHPNHWTMKPRSPKFFKKAPSNLRNGTRSFRRLKWDLPSDTVAYGNNEIHIHPTGGRRLSIYEAMLLQGFPASGYRLLGHLSDQVRLISDAVPPPLAVALAQSILEFSKSKK